MTGTTKVINFGEVDTSLQVNIDAEATARAAADALLQQNIDTEAQDRSSADGTESTTRSTADDNIYENLDRIKAGAGLDQNGNYTAPSNSNYFTAATDIKNATELLDAQAKINADAITSEATARGNADTTLQGNIDAEATTASAAEQANADAITSEATARGNADTTLQNNIDTEATTARAAEQANADAITAESTARGNADTTLQGNIDAEATTARAAEQANADAITTEATTRANADSNLQSQIDATNATQNVVDIVATKAALDTHVTTNLQVDDKIQVLVDETENNATTIYNWTGSAFSLVGTLGPYYSKFEVDTKVSNEATARADNDNTNTILIQATAEGAGLGQDGSYQKEASSNYIDNASSLANADHLLDAQISAVDDNATGGISQNDDRITTEISDRKDADTALTDKITLNNFKSITQAIELLRLYDSTLFFAGFVDATTAKPAHAANNAYIMSETIGNIWGIPATNGQLIVDDGATFTAISLQQKADKDSPDFTGISTFGDMLDIKGGQVTPNTLGKRVVQFPVDLPVGAGLSIRDTAGEAVVQFATNLSSYYTGVIDKSKAGAMIRLDTRDVAPVLGEHKYSVVQICTRKAGDPYTAYHTTVEIAAAPDGSMIMEESGAVSMAQKFSAPYYQSNNVDPASIGNPPSGKIFSGKFNGREWTKSDTGEIRYLVNDINEWYGVEFDTTVSSPDVKRIGKLDYHASLPVQNGIYACLLNDDGTENYKLDPANWLHRADGSNANLDGTDGQVMIYLPGHYLKTEQEGNYRRIKISQLPLSGFTYIKPQYVSAFEAGVQRSTSKLTSCMNNSVDFRGGNNNAAYDASDNTLLGRPVTSLSRTNFRTYARNRGDGWEMYNYFAHQTIYYFFIIEYATLNTQKVFNAALDANGYHQGGLGDGVTTLNGTSWGIWNAYNPFVEMGHSNSLGSGTGQWAFFMPDGYGVVLTVQVPRYRGIENPFGHIWKNTDGINVRMAADSEADPTTKAYISNNPTIWNDANYNNMNMIGIMPRTNGYITKMIPGKVIPQEVGAGSTIYWCDYSYQSNIPASGVSLRTVLFAGNADYGVTCGFGCSYSYYDPSDASAYIGSRLCFIPA